MTKTDNRKRIPIPKDIQRGDVLVLNTGEKVVVDILLGGDVGACGGKCFTRNGKRFAGFGGEFVVAIDPKSTRDDKDAVWLMRLYGAVGLTVTDNRRLRAIARRLNGGKAVGP